MEKNNEPMPDDDRKKLIKELTQKAEEIRRKYHCASPAEQMELNDVLEKIALLEDQKHG